MVEADNLSPIDAEKFEKIKKETLQLLEGFFLARIKLLLPQTQIREVKVKLLSGSVNLGDPETTEGASYDHAARCVNLRVNSFNHGVYITEAKSQRVFNVVPLEELLLSGQAFDSKFPSFASVLTERAIHEAAHSLTFDVWDFSLDHIVESFLEPTTPEEVLTWESLQQKIRLAFWERKEAQDLDDLYEEAYTISVELLKEQLKLIKPEKRAEFIRTAYLHGLSEIAATFLGNVASQRHIEPERQFLTYSYIYQRTDLLFPTVDQFKEITEFFKSFSFPPTESTLGQLKDLANEQRYHEFLEVSGLGDYLTAS